jgi:hypothetical protein
VEELVNRDSLLKQLADVLQGAQYDDTTLESFKVTLFDSNGCYLLEVSLPEALRLFARGHWTSAIDISDATSIGVGAR